MKYGESQTLSLKALRSKPSTLARPMVSFSNTNDGLLIVGVDDKTRKIHGAKTTKQREERLGIGDSCFLQKINTAMCF